MHGLNKYWSDHPPVFFITNQREVPGAEVIKTGRDEGWASNLFFALHRLDAEIILYSQEDYWLKTPVDHSQIISYVDLIKNDLADYIRLYPAPPPDLPFANHPHLGAIGPNSRYRASLQMAVWRKQTLLELLDPNETPWKFEVNGSKRSHRFSDRFLCVNRRRYGIEYVFTAIVNGYWSEKAYEYAQAEGLEIDYSALPQKNLFTRGKDQLRSRGYQLRKKLLGR